MVQALTIPEEMRMEFQQKVAGSGADEICAIMVGTSGDSAGSVEEMRMVKNIAKNRIADFMVDPEDFLHSVEDTNLYTDNARYVYLGIIHSHCPDKPHLSITDWSSTPPTQHPARTAPFP